MTVEVVTVNGSGCPVGTVAVAVSPDNEAFTVIYSDFLVQTVIVRGRRTARSTCWFTPRRIHFGISKADYRGYASLASGASGRLRATYYFQGETPAATRSTTWSVRWTATGRSPTRWPLPHWSSPLWCPTIPEPERSVDHLRGTSDPTYQSFLVMDSTDVDFSTLYYFTWMVCSEAEETAA